MDDLDLVIGIAATKGYTDGYVSSTVASIQALVRNLSCTFNEACDLLDVPESVRADLALNSLVEGMYEGGS